MNPQEILALPPGPEMDAAVHQHVLGESGIPLTYSTDIEAGALLLGKLSLFVTRVEKPKDPTKPWIAGTLASDPSSTAWRTTMTVTGGTMLGVLCRAALLVALRSPATLETESKPDPSIDLPVEPPRRASKRRPNGARVGTKTPPAAVEPPKAKEQAVPVRQPTIFLSQRSKLTPLPKRKPFSMPADPAK